MSLGPLGRLFSTRNSRRTTRPEAGSEPASGAGANPAESNGTVADDSFVSSPASPSRLFERLLQPVVDRLTGDSDAVLDGTAPSPAGDAQLTAEAADRIIDHTARFESLGSYSAWNPNDNNAGVSFGLIQFNQKRGTLPALFQMMYQAEPQLFTDIFQANTNNLLKTSWVRNANLNQPVLKSQIIASGEEPVFQQVQRDLAREDYFDPAADAARDFGLSSERALAMLFDVAVQYGPDVMRRRLQQAAAGGGTEIEVLGRMADLSDTNRYDGNRRHRILADPELSDAPLGSISGQPAAGQDVYTVRRGDTLGAIAARFGTTWEELAELNQLPDPDLIEPGKVLFLN